MCKINACIQAEMRCVDFLDSSDGDVSYDKANLNMRRKSKETILCER